MLYVNYNYSVYVKNHDLFSNTNNGDNNAIFIYRLFKCQYARQCWCIKYFVVGNSINKRMNKYNCHLDVLHVIDKNIWTPLQNFNLSIFKYLIVLHWRGRQLSPIRGNGRLLITSSALNIYFN